MLDNWIATPIIWKEPAQVRKERLKRFPRFYIKRVIAQVLLNLVLVPLLIFVSSLRGKATFNDTLLFFAFITAITLFALVLSGVFVHLVNCFEATYAVDEMGFRTQRAGMSRSFKWSNITELKIIPCQGLDGISLVRIATTPNQGTIPGLALESESILWEFFTRWAKGYVEFPFAEESLNVDDVFALYEKYGSPKKEHSKSGSFPKLPVFRKKASSD